MITYTTFFNTTLSELFHDDIIAGHNVLEADLECTWLITTIHIIYSFSELNQILSSRDYYINMYKYDGNYKSSETISYLSEITVSHNVVLSPDQFNVRLIFNLHDS